MQLTSSRCCTSFSLRPSGRRRGCVTHASRASQPTVPAEGENVRAAGQQQQQPVPYNYLLPRQAVAMFAAGAALGPFCDGLHSQHNVLHYVNPTVSLQLDSIKWSFETCWWVPLLFGVAGLILGVSVPLLDAMTAGDTQSAASTPQQPAAPSAVAASKPGTPVASAAAVRMGLGPEGYSWPWVNLCISLFVLQYWLSGVLEQPLLGVTLGSTAVPALDVVLCAYALLHWVMFDRSTPGLAMSALTALCGPAVEVALINFLGLYHYTHPVWFGAVPSWIPWVYFCGGPAVGNLGRIVWETLKVQHLQRTTA